MAYVALVTNIENVHKDENSDRLYLEECFREGVIVGPDMQTGDKDVDLPTDGKAINSLCFVITRMVLLVAATSKTMGTLKLLNFVAISLLVS